MIILTLTIMICNGSPANRNDDDDFDPFDYDQINSFVIKMSDVLEYLTGFKVGPTGTDYGNAISYASDIINKEACDARGDLYTWVPSTITRYPCPEGMTCSTGTCKFREDACRRMSKLPYYDCVRKQVACDTTPSGVCEICDYSIKVGRNIVGPFTEGDVPPNCWAGDEKFQPYVAYPVPLVAGKDGCTTNEQCDSGAVCVVDAADIAHFGQCVVPCSTVSDCTVFDTSATCGTLDDGVALNGRCFVPNPPPDPTACPLIVRDPLPYTVQMYDDDDVPQESKVPCVMDAQCTFSPGVGGVCGRDPSAASHGFCYNPYGEPYLEWREEIELWDGVQNRNVCVETFSEQRQWCEMPWTRTGTNENDLTVPLPQRVKDAWKSKARPPFWFDERDSTCHVTKTYCEANLKNGGFSAGYGRSTDYWLGSTCSSGGPNREVVGAYDCCTKIGDSIGEFFLGRTLTTDFRELVEGDSEGFGARWAKYMERGYNPALEQLLDFYCDSRLKRNLRMIASHVLPGDVHGYTWTWNATATSLYGLSGDGFGMLTGEVGRMWPHLVRRDKAGYEHLVVPQGGEVAATLARLGATPTFV